MQGCKLLMGRLEFFRLHRRTLVSSGGRLRRVSLVLLLILKNRCSGLCFYTTSQDVRSIAATINPLLCGLGGRAHGRACACITA